MMSRPRFELRTFCVLDKCDDQLRHRPNITWPPSFSSDLVVDKVRLCIAAADSSASVSQGMKVEDDLCLRVDEKAEHSLDWESLRYRSLEPGGFGDRRTELWCVEYRHKFGH